VRWGKEGTDVKGGQWKEKTCEEERNEKRSEKATIKT
jgi:hypothetical protein